MKSDVKSETIPESSVSAAETQGSSSKVEVPDKIFLGDYHDKTAAQLSHLARDLDLRVPGNRSKFQLIFEILSFYGRHGTEIEVEGVLESKGDSFGFLLWPRFSFTPNADSVYVAPSLIRNHGIKCGNLVRGLLRSPKHREKYLALETVTSIEGMPQEEWKNKQSNFDRLTALFPKDRIILENAELNSVSTRVVDLISPLGKGQRGLIVASPRSGKTILLKEIAKAISMNHPEIELIVLLIDERPEEVTDFRETVNASVYSSTFDETPLRHIQVAELVLERAKRLVEMKKDVVILLDSITRLSRGYNNTAGGKGGLTQGGVNPKALQKARRYFSAARNLEEGGSLTILATALVETESRMDDVIFEEFKGTGNLEIYLDKELAEKRIYPAIHTLLSGTRKDDLLYHPDELAKVNYLRRQMAQIPAGEAMEKLVRNIKRTKSNVELLLAGLK